jgi:hypothetical protein
MLRLASAAVFRKEDDAIFALPLEVLLHRAELLKNKFLCLPLRSRVIDPSNEPCENSAGYKCKVRFRIIRLPSDPRR